MAGPQILEVGANPIIHLGTVAGDLVVSGAPQSQLQMTGGVRQEVTVDAADVDRGAVEDGRVAGLQAAAAAVAH